MGDPEREKRGVAPKASAAESDRSGKTFAKARSGERDQAEIELMQLARELGSVSEACRRYGVDRSFYYRALKRKRTAEGKRMRSPLAKPLELENKIVALCLEYPDWGCDRLSWYLTLKGEAISSPTVQKILLRHGLGRVGARRAAAARSTEEKAGDSSTPA